MFDDIAKLTGKAVDKVKKKVYGKTFACPVCHLELSYHDVDGNGLCVCPLCGIVIELADVFGHAVPVVMDVAIKRHQPKLRLHPLSTHLPVGLFPFALLGSAVLLLASITQWVWGVKLAAHADAFASFAVVNRVTGLLLFLSIISSVATFASGWSDWKKRYEGRRYRCITLKIWFSGLFLGIGAVMTFLHLSGAVFSTATGLMPCSAEALVAGAIYFLLAIGNFIVMATLGHVGGLLVLGK